LCRGGLALLAYVEILVAMAQNAFPLRFKSTRLRELVREVARQANMSQNELLELAAEHEVIVRGALMADVLDAAASLLRHATTQVHEQHVQESIVMFVDGEAQPEPLRPGLIAREGEVRESTQPSHGIGAVAAFVRS